MIISEEQKEGLQLSDDEASALIRDPSDPHIFYLAMISMEKIDLTPTKPSYGREPLGKINVLAILKESISPTDDYNIQRMADFFGVSKLQLGLRWSKVLAKILKFIA